MAEMVERNSGPWYMRRDGRVQGPFTVGLVRRYILLGRIRVSDELSQDREAWRRAEDLPELVPEVMKADLSDPAAKERLMAAIRWADERGRLLADDEAGEIPETDRRQDEPLGLVQHRRILRRRSGGMGGLEQRAIFGWLLIAVLLGGFVALGAYVYGHRVEEVPVVCTSPARPGVDWSNCALQGVELAGVDLSGALLRNTDLTAASMRRALVPSGDLAYANLSLADLREADLSGANLVGANLRNALLDDADLRRADLSHANLTGASLHGIRLDGARLHKTLWMDGRMCGPGSLGVCRQ